MLVVVLLLHALDRCVAGRIQTLPLDSLGPYILHIRPVCADRSAMGREHCKTSRTGRACNGQTGEVVDSSSVCVRRSQPDAALDALRVTQQRSKPRQANSAAPKCGAAAVLGPCRGPVLPSCRPSSDGVAAASVRRPA